MANVARSMPARCEAAQAKNASNPAAPSKRMAMPIRHPTRGDTHLVGTAINMEGIESTVRRVPPRLGEHSAEILQQAGYTEGEIARLRSLGVISEA